MKQIDENRWYGLHEEPQPKTIIYEGACVVLRNSAQQIRRAAGYPIAERPHDSFLAQEWQFFFPGYSHKISVLICEYRTHAG